MSFLFGCFLSMRTYSKKRIETNDVRISVRVSENYFEYLNKCSEFFGVSKSYFIKERCLSDNFYVIHDKNVPDVFFEMLHQLSNLENEIAHDLNSLYQKTLETNRLDLVFQDVFFLDQVNKLKICIDLALTISTSMDDVLSYKTQNSVLPFYDDYFDEYNPSNCKKNKFIFIRMSQSFYRMLSDISKSMSITVTQFILNGCMNPMYLDIYSISKNKDFLLLTHSMERNLRQIKFAIMRINKRNIECSGLSLNSINKYFDEIENSLENLFQLWRKFRNTVGSFDKDLYFKFIKKRHLYDCVTQTLSEHDPDYLKIVSNREYHI